MSTLEVTITDYNTGSGELASKGALVFIHYTGTLTDGTVFDSSYNHGRPFEFVVGSKKVIQGMSQGILGMKVGGRRKIHIPAPLAYGERSMGKIPPHSDLIFEIELLESRPRE
ncbi:FKBP-type peptidyl-prolyl cis-trans isomerase [Bdellovibrio sp. SKB1291214]|uniref:FKBP-type peptidyl-prolyl cis-trans isomerase n=1 Tax=Bdellovibrio sp. SKB1291214 TaxID=1732569 RepID=UPI000B51C644|nr:FKBP-type peptidyl-prolyl cis-trans isomerase [Bdellovibrio sp. SKB1291214]UYL07752.1 FKBP-type peptidyl-prolyl cis-trans isomerase [Bdellovibrio sp. SKB1291214]